MLVGTLKALFTIDSSGFTAGMKQIEKNLVKTKARVESTSKSFKVMSIKGIGALTAIGAAAVFSTKKITSLALEMEALNRRIKFSSGSAREAAKSYDFIKKESNRLGISLKAAAKQFGSLSAAAKGTSMAGEGIRELFTAIAEISSVMSLSIYDTELVFLAFQQMMSKGKVVSEEVRRQLAERLPGAFAMMARSLGLTTAELDKFMSKGLLAADEVLPRFSATISKELAPAVDDLNESLSVSANRMKNVFFELTKMVGESDLLIFSLKALFDLTAKGLTFFMPKPKKLTELQKKIKEITDGLEEFVEQQKAVAKSAKHMQEKISGISSDIKQKFGPLINDLNDVMSKVGKIGIEASIEGLRSVRDKQLRSLTEYVKARSKIIGDNQELVTAMTKETAAIRIKIEEAYNIQVKELNKQRFDTMLAFAENALRSSTDFLIEWATGAKVSFKDMANSIIRDMMRIIAQVHIVGPLMKSFEGFISGGKESVLSSLLGNVFGFASGGIIREPVLGVGMKSGSGYAIAERGPEMVTPMGAETSEGGSENGSQRGSDEASVGGTTNFNITISALDSASVTDLMRRNPQAITVPIIEAIQGGDRGLITSMRSNL